MKVSELIKLLTNPNILPDAELTVFGEYDEDEGYEFDTIEGLHIGDDGDILIIHPHHKEWLDGSIGNEYPLQPDLAFDPEYIEKYGLKMNIVCPKCKVQHIDEGIWATRLHKKHQCQSCGKEWRPHPFNTFGIAP